MSLLLAQMRSADCAEQCPVLGVKPKTYARTEFFSVQSGHAEHRRAHRKSQLVTDFDALDYRRRSGILQAIFVFHLCDFANP
jgi:hypothetical protein